MLVMFGCTVLNIIFILKKQKSKEYSEYKTPKLSSLKGKEFSDYIDNLIKDS